MSAEILNELMRRAQSLTDDEKMRFAAHLVGEAARSSASRPGSPDATDIAAVPDPARRLEQRWLHQHREEYAGQWVALDGDRLLSHGSDGRQVLGEARRACVDIPFVVRVESSDELPFGGW